MALGNRYDPKKEPVLVIDITIDKDYKLGGYGRFLGYVMKNGTPVAINGDTARDISSFSFDHKKRGKVSLDWKQQIQGYKWEASYRGTWDTPE